jgi:signal transduction histidine kinase
MTKINERLALVERQRRFEWRLAREVQTHAAGRFVAGKTHDLLNMVQIVQLASLELARRCAPDAEEFIADLRKAADDAQRQLSELMAVARPDEVVVAGAHVGAAITRAVEIVRAASTIAVDLHLAVQPELATRCSAEELEHLIYGLTLDAAAAEAEREARSAPAAGDAEPRPIELFVRERAIDGKPWLEIVRGARVELGGEHFDLQAVEAIAVKNGGELAHSERRGGGTELVVALPVVAAK